MGLRHRTLKIVSGDAKKIDVGRKREEKKICVIQVNYKALLELKENKT